MPYENRFLREPWITQVGERWLKVYPINIDNEDIDPALVEAAMAYIPNLVAPDDGFNPPCAFAILHLCRGAMFVMVYNWVWRNVLELYGAASGDEYLGCPSEDLTKFVPLQKPMIGCVWELAPMEFERSVWVRHVMTPETPDVDAYNSALMASGPTGFPTL